jgi:hypothetical protein
MFIFFLLPEFTCLTLQDHANYNSKGEDIPALVLCLLEGHGFLGIRLDVLLAYLRFVKFSNKVSNCLAGPQYPCLGSSGRMQYSGT